MREIIGVINNSTGQLFALLNEYRDNFYDSPEFYADLIRVEKQYGSHGQHETVLICFDEFESYVTSESYTFIYKNTGDKQVFPSKEFEGTLGMFKESVKAMQSRARKNLNKQSDYGKYHGGVNNACNAVLRWIEQLETEVSK